MNAKKRSVLTTKTSDPRINRTKTSISEPLSQNVSKIPLTRHFSAINSPHQHLPSGTRIVAQNNNYCAARRNASFEPSGRPSLSLVRRSSDTRAGRQTTSVPSRGQDIRFTDVPSDDRNGFHDDFSPRVVQLSANDILMRCRETDYKEVYEISLHSAHLTKIQNLDQFTKLRVLDLSSNYIKTIENLDQNQELRELKLYDNRISRVMNLEKLKDLLHLHLQHNRITSVGDGLQSLTKLKVLRLDFNHMRQLDVQELSSCGQLTSIDLSNNSLDSISALACLPNLEELYARHNKLKKISDLSRCKKLVEVDLSYNPIVDLSGLKDMSSLKVLNVSRCHPSAFGSLGKLKDLQELNVSHCQLRSMQQIAMFFPSIQILNISHNFLASYDSLTPLKWLDNLMELSVAGNPFCDEAGSNQTLACTIHSILPRLQLINSVNLVRTSSKLDIPGTPTRPATPYPRPDSQASRLDRPTTTQQTKMASSITKIDEKEMERQLSDIQSQLSAFEAEFSAKLKNIRASISLLPTIIQQPLTDRSESGHESGVLHAKRTGSGQSVSKCSSRGGSTRPQLEVAGSYTGQYFDVAPPTR